MVSITLLLKDVALFLNSKTIRLQELTTHSNIEISIMLFPLCMIALSIYGVDMACLLIKIY